MKRTEAHVKVQIRRIGRDSALIKIRRDVQLVALPGYLAQEIERVARRWIVFEQRVIQPLRFNF
jgi:hypothetical protein